VFFPQFIAESLKDMEETRMCDDTLNVFLKIAMNANSKFHIILRVRITAFP